jgi:hypothetical protein
MANKDTSKQWFETNDTPSEAQFAQVFDWLRWKDEPITMADIAGLQGSINALVQGPTIHNLVSGPNAVELQANKLYDNFVILSATAQLVLFEWNNGSDDMECEVLDDKPYILGNAWYGSSQLIINVTCQDAAILITYKR